ncbi:MAG: hypothetical protein WCV90_01110 [Candidatus Woesearchaeota archaeon]|jgi:hypothetical protein
MAISEKLIKDLGFDMEGMGEKLVANGESISSFLFQKANGYVRWETEQALSRMTSNASTWSKYIDDAAREISSWSLKPGQTLAYTPEEWVRANVARDCANEYQKEYGRELMLLNVLHQGAVASALQWSGLSHYFSGKEGSLIEGGREGYLLALVETSSRLAPVLTFPGASSYLCATIVPYAREARTVLGEKHKGRAHFISEDAVRESARNTYRIFSKALNKDVPPEEQREVRVLVESSAAPRSTVPKSGRKPEVYIAHIDALPWENKMTTVVDHYIIDTPFREEFDSKVRELMFLTLRGMYQDKR